MTTTLLFIAVVIMVLGGVALTIYLLADLNVFFTKVPEGEIVVAMRSDKVSHFIANIEGAWVHPETGEVVQDNDADHPKPADLQLPREIWGTGIYWLGIWPFASRYMYPFTWNKYTKREGEEEYSIVPKSEIVDSLYYQAQYPIVVTGCETNEMLPLKMKFLLTTQTVHAGIALFRVKSPGWLSALSGGATGVVRDFNGRYSVEDINALQSEIPMEGEKSEFQKALLLLNDSTVGNPSVRETYGEIITAVSFIGYDIEEPKTPAQAAAITRWHAAKELEKTVTDARAKAEAAVHEGNQITTLATARAAAIKLEGTAKAEAAKLMTEAVKDNPHAGTIAIATAIENQGTATTLVLGKGVMPTKAI